MNTLKKDTTDKLAGLMRNLNIGRVLACISRDFPYGGVECEGDRVSGTTRFWAKPMSSSESIHVEIDNDILNREELSDAEVVRLTRYKWQSVTVETR